MFACFILVGMYFVYIRPKLNVFSSFHNDPDFTNYMLIIESNSEFDKKNYEKVMKHMKLFLMYYSQSFDDQSMFEKMQNQHYKISEHLNKMMFSIPNSMRRHMYMKNSVENLNLIFEMRLQEVATKYKINHVRS